MTAGPDLASAPLARAMLARGSWRPAGVQGTQRLLAGSAARRAPMLEGARSLQAWHDALAHRWRPVDMAPPALTLAASAPVSTAGISPPLAPDDGAATARGSTEPGGFPMKASSRGRGAPARISRVSAAAARAQRLPVTAPAPARPALTVTALAAPAASSAASLPVPFRSSTPAASAAAADPMPDDRVLVAAIGRRFARREVAGGFPEAASRGPAGGAENPAAPPTAPLVRWRVVDGRPAADAQLRAGARLRTSDGDSELRTVPALPALRADSPLPPQRTDPILDRTTPGVELVERPGASEAIPPPGLSVRLVPPAEAARRLAVGDDANGRRAEAQSTRSEPLARREFPPAPARPAIDIDAIVERVQRELKRREQFERERKGLF